jgi:hypothetical protein
MAIVATHAGVVFPGLNVAGNETMECVHALDLESGDLLWSLPVEMDVTSLLHFHRLLLLAGGPDDRVEVWDMWARSRVRVISGDDDERVNDAILRDHRAGQRASAGNWHTKSSFVTCIHVSEGQSGAVLYTGSNEGAVQALLFDG